MYGQQQESQLGWTVYNMGNKTKTQELFQETRTHTSVLDCLKSSYLNKDMSDVAFAFPSSHISLPAHKFVLSMRSEVFKTMFHGSLPEQGPTVQIEDVDTVTMKEVLRQVIYQNMMHTLHMLVMNLLLCTFRYLIFRKIV